MNYLEIYFNGVLKQSLPIKTVTVSIGRASSNEVVINNMGVSSFHAVISVSNGQYTIEDLNSSNGTFLNSQKISTRQKIRFEDSVTIGKHILKISEWSQIQQNSSAPVSVQESSDATVIMVSSSKVSGPGTSQAASDIKQKSFYLIVKGDLNGIKKMLLTKDSYSIGKAKKNDIRIGGFFTAAHIAEIDKVGHSFYISPVKKKKVTLNGSVISSSCLLIPSDEIRIKKLFIKFSSD